MWGASVFAVVMVLIGVITLSAGKVLEGVVALGCGFLIIGLFWVWTGLWLHPDAIRVRNPLSSFSVNWSQIKSFQIGRHRFFPACLLIDLRDGSEKYVFSVQISNASMRKPDGWERHLVNQLNQLLETQRSENGDS